MTLGVSVWFFFFRFLFVCLFVVGVSVCFPWLCPPETPPPLSLLLSLYSAPPTLSLCWNVKTVREEDGKWKRVLFWKKHSGADQGWASLVAGGVGGGVDPPDSLNGHAREVTAWRRSSSTRPVLVLQ